GANRFRPDTRDELSRDCNHTLSHATITTIKNDGALSGAIFKGSVATHKATLGEVMLRDTCKDE
ncbi:hypothetical protein BG005_009548, partial [Podila minutissima]